MTTFNKHPYLNTMSCTIGNKAHAIGGIIIFNEEGPICECSNDWPTAYDWDSNNPFQNFTIPAELQYKRKPDYTLPAFVMHIGPNYPVFAADGLFLNPEKLGMKLTQKVEMQAFVYNHWSVEWDARREGKEEKRHILHFSSVIQHLDRPKWAAQHELVEIADLIKNNTYRPESQEMKESPAKLAAAIEKYNNEVANIKMEEKAINERIQNGEIIPTAPEIVARTKKMIEEGKR